MTQKILEKNVQRIGIYGFILDNENRVLLLKRAAHDSNPNLWELPGGGLDHGENPEEGVAREVWEEANLSVQALYPLAIKSKLSDRDPHKHTIRIAYFCRLLEPKSSVTLSNEHSDFSWVNPSGDLPSPVSGLVKICLQAITSNPELIP